MIRLDAFNDTRFRINNDKKLTEYTENSACKTKVFDEDFFSDKKPFYKDTEIAVEENLTLITAARFSRKGLKTAVLNFANPVSPGGGILRGAKAQEEYLCRAGSLYYSLTSKNSERFYALHRALLGEDNTLNSGFAATDTVIYSPDVVFIREDVGYIPGEFSLPTQEYTENHYFADVITCAAPCLYYKISDNTDKLQSIFEKRITNILEVAIENGIQVLVLGAFGCGAFRNPPETVAKAFRNILVKERYRHAFQKICFAIKKTGNPCPNFNAFESAMSNI